MGSLKSRDIHFGLSLYQSLISDMVQHYAEPDLQYDYKTICRRTEREGFAFLSKTLPAFAKAIDKALVYGRLTYPSAFKRAKGQSLPRFLLGLTSRVFDKTGELKGSPDVSAVRGIRQICYLLYKYEQPKDLRKEAQHVKEFFDVDESLCDSFKEFADGKDLSGDLPDILEVATTLLRAVEMGYDHEKVRPKHGPGAVATGEKLWEKFAFSRFYPRLHERFPYYKYFFSNALDLASNARLYHKIKSNPMEPIAAMLEVPKDSRGGRLISEEPLEQMWIQQGIKDVLYNCIERHPLTRGHVNFSDQTVNRDLALMGSISSDIVTLDMKEGSDRHALWLVKLLLADTTLLADILACRTGHTSYDGKTHRLRKFAPMGSALCFPIMSLVHWSLAVATLYVVDRISLVRALKAVYVYGDDIIIKRQNHKSLFDIFPQLGMKFNEGKCCTAGHFRESCGMDAFYGEEITPIRIKKNAPSSRKDADRIVAFLEQANAFRSRGLLQTANYLTALVEQYVGELPTTKQNWGFLSKIDACSVPSDQFYDWSYCKYYHNECSLDSNSCHQKGGCYCPATQQIVVPVLRIVNHTKKVRSINRREYLRILTRYTAQLTDRQYRGSSCLLTHPQTHLARYIARSEKCYRKFSGLDYLDCKTSATAGVYGVPRAIRIKRGHAPIWCV